MAESQRTQPRSETFRYFVATTVGLVAGLAFSIWIIESELVFENAVTLMIVVYLAYWVVYVAAFGWLTLKTLSGRGEDELQAYATAERKAAGQHWVKFWGAKGASSLSLFASIVAMGAAIAMSQIDLFRSDWRWMLLAGSAVVASWIYMVIMYAAEFLELDYAARDAGKEPLFKFDHGENDEGPAYPEYDDYLGLSVMISTMGAGMPAQPLNRLAWREVRANTAVAFMFNTMIIAMVVSVLSSTISS